LKTRKYYIIRTLECHLIHDKEQLCHYYRVLAVYKIQKTSSTNEDQAYCPIN
jgi:hypothetical protein